MSLLDKMLAAKGVKTAADIGPASDAKPKRLPPAGKLAVTPSKIEPVTVVALCGHDVLVESPHPKFAKQQIANIAAKNCKACRQEHHQQLLARQAAAAALNPNRKKKSQGSPARPVIERLPDGATFTLTYSAERVQWTGLLQIDGMPLIRIQHGAVFKLLQKLDSEYRRQVAQKNESPVTSEGDS